MSSSETESSIRIVTRSDLRALKGYVATAKEAIAVTKELIALVGQAPSQIVLPGGGGGGGMGGAATGSPPPAPTVPVAQPAAPGAAPALPATGGAGPGAPPPAPGSPAAGGPAAAGAPTAPAAPGASPPGAPPAPPPPAAPAGGAPAAPQGSAPGMNLPPGVAAAFSHHFAAHGWQGAMGQAAGGMIGGLWGPTGQKVGGMLGGALASTSLGQALMFGPAPYLAGNVFSNHFGQMPGFLRYTTAPFFGAMHLGGQIAGAGLHMAGRAAMAPVHMAGSAIGHGIDTGSSMLSNFANNSVSAAIGTTNLQQLPFTGAQRYLEVSKALEQVEQRFASSSSRASEFASSLGYTLDMAGSLANALGAVTNTVDQGQGGMFLGASRFMGATNPAGVLSSLGSIARMSGGVARPHGGEARDLETMIGASRMMGMHEGRFEEFLSLMQESVGRHLSVTGHASVAGALPSAMLGRFVYGSEHPLTADPALSRGLESTFQSEQMRTFVMRAQGYGSEEFSARAAHEGTTAYMLANRLADAGAMDPSNVSLLFETMQARGFTKDQMFEVLRSQSGGALNSAQIEAMVNAVGSPEGLSAYQRQMVGGGIVGTARDTFQGLLTERGGSEIYGKGGMAALGQTGISAGEVWEQKLETILIRSGAPLVTMIGDLQTSALNLMDAWDAFAGKHTVGGILDAIGAGAVKISEAIENKAGQGVSAPQLNLPRPGAPVIDGTGLLPEWYNGTGRFDRGGTGAPR